MSEDASPQLTAATDGTPAVAIVSDRYERKLPSGRVATFLKRSTGDHVARASRLLRPEEQSNMLLLGWALATIVAKVDGERFLVEDRGAFERDDFLILSTEALQGKG